VEAGRRGVGTAGRRVVACVRGSVGRGSLDRRPGAVVSNLSMHCGPWPGNKIRLPGKVDDREGGGALQGAGGVRGGWRVGWRGAAAPYTCAPRSWLPHLRGYHTCAPRSCLLISFLIFVSATCVFGSATYTERGQRFYCLVGAAETSSVLRHVHRRLDEAGTAE